VGIIISVVAFAVASLFFGTPVSGGVSSSSAMPL